MLSSWVSHSNGGVFEAVAAQAELLASLGAEPVVLGLRDLHSDADAWRLGDVERHLCDPAGPAFLGYAPKLATSLGRTQLDLLHLHGIWQYPSHAAARWAEDTGKPLVISPHGMLDPWITGRNAWKKHIGRVLWEQRAWKSAAVFHALTNAEAHDIAHETRGTNVAKIPNPAPPVLPDVDANRRSMVLYIGRIHPKKNLAALVDGWKAARAALPDKAVLTIAGWGDDEGIDTLEHAIRDHAGSNIEFVGTAFGSQKAALLDLARFVVLPSLSEGLPMAILEAWSAGVPTIMSEHCHLPEAFAHGAAIACGTTSDTIARALVEGYALPETDWQRMSVASRALASGPFSPATVAEKWERLYAALLA